MDSSDQLKSIELGPAPRKENSYEDSHLRKSVDSPERHDHESNKQEPVGSESVINLCKPEKPQNSRMFSDSANLLEPPLSPPRAAEVPGANEVEKKKPKDRVLEYFRMKDAPVTGKEYLDHSWKDPFD